MKQYWPGPVFSLCMPNGDYEAYKELLARLLGRRTLVLKDLLSHFQPEKNRELLCGWGYGKFINDVALYSEFIYEIADKEYPFWEPIPNSDLVIKDRLGGWGEKQVPGSRYELVAVSDYAYLMAMGGKRSPRMTLKAVTRWETEIPLIGWNHKPPKIEVLGGRHQYRKTFDKEDLNRYVQEFVDAARVGIVPSVFNRDASPAIRIACLLAMKEYLKQFHEDDYPYLARSMGLQNAISLDYQRLKDLILRQMGFEEDEILSC